MSAAGQRTPAPERRRPGRCDDQGAAAVEFALLLPIFVVLTVGSISAGIVFWHSISASQGVRDAARYGSTLPLTTAATPPANTYSATTWLDAVMGVALRESGIGDVNGDSTVDGADALQMDAQLCVAFVKGTASTHALATASKRWGGGAGASAAGTAGTTACVVSDGAPQTVDRVQVVFKRDEEFNAIFFQRDVTPEARSVQPYQRGVS